MKKIFLAIMTLGFLSQASAQAPVFKTPGEYMDYVGVQMGNIQEESWNYTRMMAHNKSPRKIENQRKTLTQTILDSKSKIQKVPAYKGNSVYKDSVLHYLNIEYLVFNHDYAKIVDMQEVSEQAYDLMEAYMLAKDKANEKLAEAYTSYTNGFKEFANANNIKIIQDDQDKTAKKLQKANLVYGYYNVIYLIFFKSYKQESYVLDAMKTGDLAAMEQNIDKLKSTAEEGLGKIGVVQPFDGDNSIMTSCKEMLNFYKDEAGKFNLMKDFFLKDLFDKVKKAFDSKPQAKRTQADIDTYNKALKDYNGTIESYNKTNQSLNQQRSTLLQKWNSSVDKFTEKHISAK